MEDQLQYNTSIVLDTRRPKDNGLYPVKLRVYSTQLQVKKLYATKFDLSKEDFASVWKTERPRKEFIELRDSFQAIQSSANSTCKELKQFSFKDFEKKYIAHSSSKETLESLFSDYSKQLRKEGRIGTAVSYECAQRSLCKFREKAKFTDVTTEFLEKYEKWMLDKGNSITTIGIYLRSLRTLFNSLIDDGSLPKEYYPFGKKKYEIPTGVNVKKALSLEEIALIYYHKAEVHLARSKAFWLFIYFCNGINVKDLCLLKYKNIKNDFLEFERAKTARRKRKVEPIRVHLNDDLLQIIKNWGNKNDGNETYIFPILSKGLSPERERQLIQQFTSVLNSHMKIITKQLNIQNSANTYVARHSFATILQRSGATTAFISEALGHSSVTTTQSYLAGFEDETKKETAKALTAFKKPKKKLLKS